MIESSFTESRIPISNERHFTFYLSKKGGRLINISDIAAFFSLTEDQVIKWDETECLRLKNEDGSPVNAVTQRGFTSFLSQSIIDEQHPLYMDRKAIIILAAFAEAG